MVTNASGAAASISGGGAPDGPPHLVHVFPSFEYGGVPIRISTIINHLGDRYRHTILSLDGNTVCSSRLDRSIQVDLVDPAIDKSRPFSSFLNIRRILKTMRPDLLLTYSWGSIEWALVNGMLGFRHVHLESGFSTQEADRQLPRRVWARRLGLARSRCLIVPSFTLVNLAKAVWRIDPAKIRHIPNGVDCGRFASAPDPSAAPGFNARPGQLVVGTVAPLRPEKDLHRLLRVFAAVAGKSAARLLIAGDGDQRPALEAAVRSLGLTDRVVFAGHVEAPEKVYGLMDVFAISSDTEQMPNTLIQAMAAFGNTKTITHQVDAVASARRA